MGNTPSSTGTTRNLPKAVRDNATWHITVDPVHFVDGTTNYEADLGSIDITFNDDFTASCVSGKTNVYAGSIHGTQAGFVSGQLGQANQDQTYTMGPLSAAITNGYKVSVSNSTVVIRNVAVASHPTVKIQYPDVNFYNTQGQVVQNNSWYPVTVTL